MRRLLPTTEPDVDPLSAYEDDRRRPVGERPWVLLNMIASLDGGTAVQGRSGALGGPADKAVFRAIRAVADVVLVAAGTVRAEHYRAPMSPDGVADARRTRGQAAAPRLAIVSGRLELDESLPLFDPDQPRPIVVTTVDAPEDRRKQLARRAEVVACGRSRVDLVEALALLRARYSAEVVLSEGGPSLNGALAEAGLLDEVCLSVAPYVVGGESRRIVHGAPPLLGAMTLAHVLEEDGYLFLRYVRDAAR